MHCAGHLPCISRSSLFPRAETACYTILWICNLLAGNIQHVWMMCPHPPWSLGNYNVIIIKLPWKTHYYIRWQETFDTSWKATEMGIAWAPTQQYPFWILNWAPPWMSPLDSSRYKRYVFSVYGLLFFLYCFLPFIEGFFTVGMFALENFSLVPFCIFGSLFMHDFILELAILFFSGKKSCSPVHLYALTFEFLHAWRGEPTMMLTKSPTAHNTKVKH